MDFINALKKLFLQGSISDQPGLTDAEFFKRVLLVLPDQARIEFDQTEPALWVDSLCPWSYRQNSGQFEADYYVIEPAFVATLSALVDADPQPLDSCHHMSAVDENGERLFSSLDNFCVVNFRENVAQALAALNKEQ